MKDMRTLRKADIPAVGAALVWTGVFLAALLVIFCLEGAPTVAHLKAGQIASVAAMEEKTMLELNTADKEELMTLPGIGIVQAKQAMEFRAQQGGFRSVDEFIEVLQIKPHFAVQILSRASVSAAPQPVHPVVSGAARRRIDF